MKTIRLRKNTLSMHTVAQMAQSVEHQAFNLRVQGSSPCLGGYFDEGSA